MREVILKALGRRSKHRGVSLLLVLLIAFCGTAILGMIVYSVSGLAGASRVSIKMEDIYVRMQSEIESAKAALILAMSATDKPLKMRDISFIHSLDDLVVHVNGGTGGLFEPARVDKTIRVGGVDGFLSVRILDMQYKAGSVEDDSDLIAILPPCMESLQLTSSASEVGEGEPSDPEPSGGGAGGGASLGSGSAGVYLIRATVTIGGKTNIIETSVIQRTGS